MKRIAACLALILPLLIVPPSFGDQDIGNSPCLKEGVLGNGKAMYETGKRSNGAHLAFTGGPNWLHVKGGGCKSCHGKRGWGYAVPEDCTVSTPPITYRYLSGDGYPFKSRQDGSHPIYTLNGFKNMIRLGVKSNGDTADFCMPRWRLSNNEICDLLAYLLALDKQ